MTIFQSIILGLIQGIAEFLPISSSGHLKVTQELFELSDIPLIYDVFLHIATLLVVFIYFRKVIWRLICVLFRFIFKKPDPQIQSEDSKINNLAPTDKAGMNTILMIIITTFITGIMGILTKKLIDDDSISIKFTCAGFILTAILLIISGIMERRRTSPLEFQNIRWYQALIIGFAQGIGTLPGISRSGSTIAGAQLCGVERSKAGDYSFIVSIPAILGAFVLTLKDYFDEKAIEQAADYSSKISSEALFAGFTTAFVSGYLALALLMKLINKGKLYWFAAYLIPAGILGLIFF